MSKKILNGLIYVSAWIVIWGTAGSLIDFPLLKAGTYQAGSLGQASTFFLTSLISIFLGIKFFNSLKIIK